jgi:hypothetical protein
MTKPQGNDERVHYSNEKPRNCVEKAVQIEAIAQVLLGHLASALAESANLGAMSRLGLNCVGGSSALAVAKVGGALRMRVWCMCCVLLL